MNLFFILGWICAGLCVAADTSTVIRNVTVIDPGSGLVAAHWSVLLEGGKIQALGVIAEPAGVRAIEGGGRFLIPGLWDMHVHLWNERNFPELYLAFGVTGVRDMGSPFAATLALRKAIEAGTVAGPHILTSGPAVDGRPGEDLRLPVLTVSSPDQARRAVDEIDDMGADFVKVFSGIELEPYMAMLERARQLRLPVAGHLPTKVRLEDAVQLRQASIEHFLGMERTGEARLKKAFAAAAEQGIRFTPTLTMHKRSLWLGVDAVDERAPVALRKMWEAPRTPGAQAAGKWAHYQEMTRWLREARVEILAGTDTGDPYTVPGASLQDELVLLVKAGLTPIEALRAATSEAARFNQLERLFGAVRPGLVADVVLLDGDPLVEIGNIRKVSGVCWRGRCYDKAGIAELLRGQ